MFKNYFITAWRNLWSNKLYAALNISGLSVGLAASILIILWVKDELSFDKFHKHPQDLYLVVSDVKSEGARQAFAFSPPAVGVYGKDHVPQVANSVRVSDNDRYNIYKSEGKAFSDIKSAFIDPSFFSIFDFTLIAGDPRRPFPNENSVIISATTAKKYFDAADPIGKIIVVDNKDNFIVNGVIKDFPGNSSLKYDMLFPISLLEQDYSTGLSRKSMNDDWSNYYCKTFFQLLPKSSTKNVENTLTQLLHQHLKNDLSVSYRLQSLTKIHLYSPDGSSAGMQVVKIFLSISVFLLLIACINYVNLSTARSTIRAKEVSMRKIVGATRLQLFLQFIVESALVFCLATVLGLVIIYFLMPLYNEISGKNMRFSLLSKDLWFIVASILLISLLLSAIYPAMLLSSFKPMESIKGTIIAGLSNTRFRKTLVIVQFVFSIGLITSTLVINNQLNYIRTKQLGYDKTHVFSFWMRDFREHYNAVKTELLSQPGIAGVTSLDGDLINSGANTGDTYWEGKQPNRLFLVTQFGIDKDFIPIMKMDLVHGTNFSGVQSDSMRYILNETAVNDMGLKDPVGKLFRLHNVEGTIIGVVKDFHFRSLKEKIQPAVFYYSNSGRNMFIKPSANGSQVAIGSVTRIWKQYNASFPFDYNFLDKQYDALYRSEVRTGSLFMVFAAIAILVSCLGLFGLAAYSVHLKMKELSIRKVLGAGTKDLMIYLSKDFMEFLLIAILIAMPLAWFAMNKWLQNFAYRINLSWWTMAAAAIIAVFTAFLAIGLQIIKASMTNPVKNLRT